MTLHTHVVPLEARGERLDAFVSRIQPELSRSRVKALIEEKAILVDGAAVKPARFLRGGESIEVTLAPPREATPQPEEIALSVLFEDASLIAVDKPAGMVVHPAAGNPDGTLVNALLHHCKDLAGIGGERRPGIVHRLDKDTSGCIVVAKREDALQGLQAQFKGRTAKKTYLAIVHGNPAPSGAFDTLHGRHPTDRKRFTGKVKVGRRAQTTFTTLETFPGAALVSVEIHTGRTHQIRVHFAEAGFPLLHDRLYGGLKKEARLEEESPVRRAAEAIGRQALHAQRLELTHPKSRKPLLLEAPIPADFLKGLVILRAAGAPAARRVRKR